MERGRIIALLNPTGGAGRTATALELGRRLASGRRRVLLLDLTGRGELPRLLPGGGLAAPGVPGEPFAAPLGALARPLAPGLDLAAPGGDLLRRLDGAVGFLWLRREMAALSHDVALVDTGCDGASADLAALVAGWALLPSVGMRHCASGAERALARLVTLAALGPAARPLALVPHRLPAGLGCAERLAGLGCRHGVPVAVPIPAGDGTRAVDDAYRTLAVHVAAALGRLDTGDAR